MFKVLFRNIYLNHTGPPQKEEYTGIGTRSASGHKFHHSGKANYSYSLVLLQRRGGEANVSQLCQVKVLYIKAQRNKS